jgi:ribokinase
VVLTAGSLHLDVIVTAPHLPRLDETVAGSAAALAFGGKGGNQAVAAARMGAESHMAGAVGEDAFAAMLLAGLDAGGVARGGVQRVPGPSGMSAAIVQGDGGYGAVIVSGANLAFDPARVVFPPGCGTLLLQNEVPEGANLALAARARAAGVRVILNAAPARDMAPRLLALCDLVVVNRGEAAALLGADLPPAQAAARLAARGPGRVVVTLGAGGLATAEGLRPAPAVRVVSTHGAGDAFVGALAAEWGLGAAFDAALDFAQGAAALHVASPVEARATLDEGRVRRFLAG